MSLFKVITATEVVADWTFGIQEAVSIRMSSFPKVTIKDQFDRVCNRTSDSVCV